jgi:GNAT superfamily N-acetyltransferase
MTFAKALHKLRRHARDYGISHTLRTVALYPLAWLFVARSYRISRLDLTTVQPLDSGDKALQYRFITAADQEIIRQIEAMEEWLEGLITPKLEAGDLCVVAMDGNDVAGFKFVTFGRRIGIIDWTRAPRPGTAWVYMVAVRRDLRGHGIASELRNRMAAELRRRGIARLYSGVMTFNVPSLRSQRKGGYREIVNVRFRRLLWFGWRRFDRIHAGTSTPAALTGAAILAPVIFGWAQDLVR